MVARKATYGKVMSAPHLQPTMNAQEYIQSKLAGLKPQADVGEYLEKQQLEEAIFRAVMSKKFRKYSVNPEYVEHIKAAIGICTANNQPIKFSLVFGGYKLWRLDEAPQPDWAELFSLMYYTAWVKAICAVYEPGVCFDFFSDDAIVPKLNNIELADTNAYLQHFRQMLVFMKPYIPANLNLTLNRVGDQYESSQEFEDEVTLNVNNLRQTLPGGLPQLNDEMRAAIELNVRLLPGQEDDPLWREKVQLLHDGYALVSKRRPYYRTDDKLMVITRPIPNSIAVGTTKESVMKFWIGAGALRPQADSYRQIILSPNQLAASKFTFEPVHITGLDGKNFQKIRVLQ